MQSPPVWTPASLEEIHSWIPSGARRLCLMAIYVPPNQPWETDTIAYLHALETSDRFDCILLLANQELATQSPPPLAPLTSIHYFPNMAMDFGLWWRILLPLHDLETRFDSLLLCNDSCRLVDDLTPFFELALTPPSAMTGIYESFEITRHLQSFCLLLHGHEALAALRSFVQSHLILRPHILSKCAVVRTFEIGLSQHMIRHHVPLRPLFPYQQFASSPSPPVNPSLILWHRAPSCPLLKKKNQK